MKTIWIILGSISLGLGILGIFLPLLPTTPFLLLTAALYFKGSPRLYQWLIMHPRLGTYIRNYRENKAITFRTKVVSISMLWATMLFCIFFVVEALWLRILLACIMVGVTVHLLRFKTLRNDTAAAEFRPITSAPDIAAVAALAGEIWREHYSPLVASEEQLEYMINEMQSEQVIGREVGEQGYEYYFISVDGCNIGYFGVKPCDDRLFLSKLYILRGERGKGYARAAFRFMEGMCRAKSLCAIWLTVGSHNDTGLNIYRKSGFRVTGRETSDIGGGIVMDDYVMEKEVA